MKRYTMDDLMRVTSEEKISVHGREVTVYMRTIGQTADDYRRNYATAEARKLLRSLRDTESEEYAMYIAPLALEERPELEDMALRLQRPYMEREAIQEIVPLDTEEVGKEATVADVVRQEEEEDQIAEDVNAERRKHAERRLEEYKADLAKMDLEKLRDVVRAMHFDSIIANRFDRAFSDATLFHAVFKDKKHSSRLFAGIADVAECDPIFRQVLLQRYYLLDQFSADGDGLKN